MATRMACSILHVDLLSATSDADRNRCLQQLFAMQPALRNDVARSVKPIAHTKCEPHGLRVRSSMCVSPAVLYRKMVAFEHAYNLR